MKIGSGLAYIAMIFNFLILFNSMLFHVVINNVVCLCRQEREENCKERKNYVFDIDPLDRRWVVDWQLTSYGVAFAMDAFVVARHRQELPASLKIHTVQYWSVRCQSMNQTSRDTDRHASLSIEKEFHRVCEIHARRLV